MLAHLLLQMGSTIYSIESKYDTLSVSTDYIGWRLVAMLISYFVYMNNGAFWMCASLFAGPLSLRALCGCKPFHPDKTIDP